MPEHREPALAGERAAFRVCAETFLSPAEAGSPLPRPQNPGSSRGLRFLRRLRRREICITRFETAECRVSHRNGVSASRCDEVASRCDEGASRRDVGASRCDEVASRCDEVASRCDEIASRCDEVASRCDEVASRCDEIASRCDEVASRCDEGASRCDEIASRCDEVASRCDEGAPRQRLSMDSNGSANASAP